ncbi:MAG: glycosyltransferase family 4 protein [Candidatus Limnocylindrales bacterium]
MSLLPRLRVAQVAPLFESVPPAAYGGTELMVHLLTEELVRRGHQVTLFASGDSRTSAELRAGSPFALWSKDGRQLPGHRVLELTRAHHQRPYVDPGAFDIVHDHSGGPGIAAAVAAGSGRTLVTHHLKFQPELGALLRQFPGRHHAVSRFAAETFPADGQLEPVLHGVEVETFPFREDPDGYLLFLGRFAPEKGAGTAVQVARRSGRRLLLAGRINPSDRESFERDVEPYLDGTLVDYLGEADATQKRALLAGADLLIFPIAWDEPFGLVMIEALSCGTPVLATARASTPEVVDHGVTGMLAGPGDGSEADIEAMLGALPACAAISRQRCRQEALRRFTVARMVDDYERRYATLLGVAHGEVISGNLVGESGPS